MRAAPARGRCAPAIPRYQDICYPGDGRIKRRYAVAASIVGSGRNMSGLLTRITIDPNQMHGRPCIRGMRITVADILGLLLAGQSRETILQDYPYLESSDIDAVLAFAARS
jgi:uncharacterized protein (DUF433 family)